MEERGPSAEDRRAPSGAKEGVLYVVATVHLDTQWRWTIQRTISDYLPATLEGNFELFEKYPHYVLSWEGAFRYMLIREYYPEAWERLKHYAREGRWTVAGSMLESVDVNLVSPESLVRQFLYGSRFFERELGGHGCDVFLPDCFGFGFSLPSIAAHCGLIGFSSQKFIKWAAPAEMPFDIGIWEGPDGASLLSVLDPEGYGDGIDEELSRAERWRRRIRALGDETGLYAGYKYFGIGDRGGAPDERSLRLLERSREDPGPLTIEHGRSDQFFRDIGDRTEGLRRYRGELLLPEHGAGCYTALASMKRWNRKNELLAQAAELAACGAHWAGALPYPADALREGWLRFLWHQMHDDLTGTSIPRAYDFSWNDEALASNRFATVLTDSLGALAATLDTDVAGIPLVVFNPLSVEREDVAEAQIRFPGATPAAVRVFGPDGLEVPAQASPNADGSVHVAFLAQLPATGIAVYDLRPSHRGCTLETSLRATTEELENHRYRVSLDSRGDIASIYDHRLGRELLAAPLRLELLRDYSPRFPAWELRYRDVQGRAEPVRRLLGVEVIERGPARVALEVRRAARGSTFRQRIRLSAGPAGERLEIDTRMEWRTWARMLKAAFPVTVPDAEATYDLGLGVIQRGTNRPDKYEVPAQQWADLSAADRSFGVSILNDCKYGWDRPEERTLRLTLTRSPFATRGHPHQTTQDYCSHRFTYAVYGHEGSWADGGTVSEAARLNQPLLVFEASGRRSGGPRTRTLLEVSEPGVAIRAAKRAEDEDGWVVRLQEIAGRSHERVAVRPMLQGLAAREVDGVENEIGPGEIREGALLASLEPYQPRAFSLRVDQEGEPHLEAREVELPLDTAAASWHGQGRGPDFDGDGHSLPGELLPATIESGGLRFRMASHQSDPAQCVACRGQRVELPPGEWSEISFLAASVGGAATGVFHLDRRQTSLQVADWSAPIGYASHRRAIGRVFYGAPKAGFVQWDPVAWVATHRHDRLVRDQPYVFGYLFRYTIDLGGAGVLTLPDRPAIRIFAASVARRPGLRLRAALPLYR